jgi:hypothetical protein
VDWVLADRKPMPPKRVEVVLEAIRSSRAGYANVQVVSALKALTPTTEEVVWFLHSRVARSVSAPLLDLASIRTTMAKVEAVAP